MRRTVIECDKCGAEILPSTVEKREALIVGAIPMDVCIRCENTITVADLRMTAQMKHDRALAIEQPERAQ